MAEQRPVDVCSELVSSYESQVRSSPIELNDSPNQEMKQDAMERGDGKKTDDTNYEMERIEIKEIDLTEKNKLKNRA